MITNARADSLLVINYGNEWQSKIMLPLHDVFEGGLLATGGINTTKYLYDRSGNAKIDSSFDETGYECHINSIHIEDYVQDKKEWVKAAFGIIRHLSEFKRTNRSKGVIRNIITFDDLTCVYRFHTSRMNQTWLSANLESYEQESVIVVDI